MSPSICWLLSHSTILSFLFFIAFFIPNHHAFTSIISGRRRSSSLSFVTTTKTMIPTKAFPLSDQRRSRSTTASSLVRLYSSFRPDSDNDEGEKKNDDDDETNNSNYYDDFGDFAIGDGSSSFISSTSDNSGSGTSSSSMSSSLLLQERMNQLIQQERQWQEQISKNWKLGQWSVRGCSLDPYSSSSDEEDEATKIQISSLCALPNYDDDDDTAADIVLVGRTDGSLCWLQLGGPGDYLATFTQQLVAKDAPSNDDDDDGNTDSNDGDDDESSTSSSLGGMIVSQELKREGQPQQTASFSNTNNPSTTIVGYDDNTPNVNYNKNSFEILAQLPTVSTGPIRNMKIIDDVLYYIDDSQPNQIFRLSNSVSSFLQQEQQKTPSSSSLPLDEIHTSPIISLMTHNHKDNEDTTTTTNTPVMVSISDNGQVVFWKQTTGNMVPFHQLQIPFQSDNSVVLSCDIDSDYLYFGDSNGIFYVYSNHYHNNEFDSNDAALLEQQQQPLQIFQAFSNGGISALCAAGESSMGTGGRVLTTRTIIAGSTRGEIRQWELIPRNNNSGSTAGVEFWPRLASQTIPGKAHIFDSKVSSEQEEGGSFSAASSTILSLRVIEKDNVILSANANEIQFWDPKSGKLHFDMQGLEFVFVACEILKDASLMVTNGMGQYVCVHDFTIDPSTVESFLELDDTDDDGY